MAWFTTPAAIPTLAPDLGAHAAASLAAAHAVKADLDVETPAVGLHEVVPGDEQGFAELIRRHETLVFGLALYFLRDAAEAEELAQDVFWVLFRHRHSIESERHLMHWLRQVTCRRCLDRRRRRRVLFTLGHPDALEQDWPAVPPPQADPWLARRLRQLLASLPARMRLVLLLRYQQDLQPEEIAEVLNLPRATVKSHLRRGLARLRRRLPPAARPGFDGAGADRGVNP